MDKQPLGIPLDELKRFAFALMELDLMLQTSGAGRALNLCDELRSELDQHIFAEFTDLPEQERFDITYTTDALGFTGEHCSLDHVLAILPELCLRLNELVPGSRAQKLAQSLAQELEKPSVLQKLRASQERLEYSERSA